MPDRTNRDEREHDPNDYADAYVLLDDGEARLGLSECCGRFICTCDDFGLEPARERWRRPAPRLDK